jgi:hypothetical protein
MSLSRQEKERLVLDLYYNQGKTFRDIAKEVRMSFTDIGFIIRRKEVEEEEKNNTTSNKNHQQQLSLFAKAYKLYFKGKSPVQVAINLNIPEAQATQFYREYWRLKGLYKLDLLYEKIDDKLWFILKLYEELIEKRGMSIDKVSNLVDIGIEELPYMETLHKQVTEEVDNLREIKMSLLEEIAFLEAKISKLKETEHLYEANFNMKKDYPAIPKQQEFNNDEGEQMKMLFLSIANYIQAIVNKSLSSSAACSNHTLSLPSASSSTILPVQLNQSHSYRRKCQA